MAGRELLYTEESFHLIHLFFDLGLPSDHDALGSGRAGAMHGLD
jgi:hypothetical protein